jgi:hypothetical protein
MSKTPAPSRERDEQILDWLSRRASGESCASIARVDGTHSGIVVVATNNIRNADIAESGEPVLGAYW